MNKLRNFLLVLIATLISLQLSAQDKKEKLFRIGVKVSPNFYWVNYKTEGYTANSQSPGIGFGFISDFLISDNFMIKTGLDFYSIKLNYTMPYSFNPDTLLKINYSGSLDRKATLRYFDIPVTIKYIAWQSSKFSVNAQFGVRLGFNYRARANETFSYIDLNMSQQSIYREKVNIAEETAGMKMAFVLGGGIEYKIGKSSVIFCTFMINPGVTNILSGFNTANTNLLNKATANNIELSIGVII